MGDLHKKLSFLRTSGKDIGDVWAVRINSGKFGVQWERTKRILEQCAVDLKVVRPPEEGEDGEKEGITISVRDSQILEKDAVKVQSPTATPKPEGRKRKSVEEDEEGTGTQNSKVVVVEKKKKKKKKKEKTADGKRLINS